MVHAVLLVVDTKNTKQKTYPGTFKRTETSSKSNQESTDTREIKRELARHFIRNLYSYMEQRLLKMKLECTIHGYYLVLWST